MTTTTTATRLQLTKLGQHIGARIEGLDLSGDLDPNTIDAIRSALNEHKALVFSQSGISTDEQQERFASHFGPLTTAHPTVTFEEQVKKTVLPVDSEQSVANQWHTDVTFIVNPPQLSTLRAVTLPPYGGETLIANAAAAYRSLPKELQNLADTLWAEHSNDSDYVKPRTLNSEREKQYQEAFVSEKYRTIHPVVRVHPLTGEKGLFIGTFARHLKILGVSPYESVDILRTLQTTSPARSMLSGRHGNQTSWCSSTTGSPSTTPLTTTIAHRASSTALPLLATFRVGWKEKSATRYWGTPRTIRLLSTRHRRWRTYSFRS